MGYIAWYITSFEYVQICVWKLHFKVPRDSFYFIGGWKIAISLKRLNEIFSYMASLLQFLPKFNGEVVWSLLIDVYAERECSTTCTVLLTGLGQLYPLPWWVDGRGQGPVWTSLSVPRQVLPPDPANASRQVHRSAGQILLRMEKDTDADLAHGQASQETTGPTRAGGSPDRWV